MTTPVTPTTNTPTTSTASSASQGQGVNALASLSGNFQSFLSLLTTQLKNQDPLNPTDTTQFTQQLTMMSGVEQQLMTNSLLQQLVSVQGGLPAAAGLIGKTVTAPDPNGGATPISGVVTAVQQTNGQTMLTVGQSQIALSAVTGIAANSSNPLAALLGG
jgi:flagellar basal-body rod modification protein FlgD